MLADTKSSGTSFFDALFSAYAQVPTSAAPSFAMQDATAGTKQNQQANTDQSKDTQTQPRSENPQATVALVGQKPAAVTVGALQESANTTLIKTANSTGRAPRNGEKQSADSNVTAATTPVQAPQVPQLQVDFIQATPVSVLPVPASAPAQPVQESNGSQSSSETQAMQGADAKSNTLRITTTTVQILQASADFARATSVSVPPFPSHAIEENSSSSGAPETVGAKSNRSLPMIPAASQALTDDAKTPVTPSKTPDATLAETATAPAQTQDTTTSQPTGATGFALASSMTPVAVPLSSFVLPSNSLLPSFTQITPQITGAAQNDKADNSAISKPAGGSNTGATNTSSQTSFTTTPATASSHNTQGAVQNTAQNNASNSPAGQHAQADSTQVAVAAAKPSDATAVQVQTIASHGPAHEVADSHGSTANTGDVAHASNQTAGAEAADAPTATGINTSRVIQKMSETEMRVGINSAEFGEISIRTSVSQQQMTTQISVDHGDLGKAITAQIPAMQQKLGDELGLRATVEVNQNGMSFSGEREQSSQKQQRTSAPVQQTDNTVTTEAEYPAARTAIATGDGYRLDIRA